MAERAPGDADGRTEQVVSVACAPDGRTLASAGADRTIRLWDVARRAPLATLTGHEDYANDDRRGSKGYLSGRRRRRHRDALAPGGARKAARHRACRAAPDTAVCRDDPRPGGEVRSAGPRSTVNTPRIFRAPASMPVSFSAIDDTGPVATGLGQGSRHDCDHFSPADTRGPVLLSVSPPVTGSRRFRTGFPGRRLVAPLP
ncbi:WD40 repeat domain-containing protein [Streptomyces deserti]